MQSLSELIRMSLAAGLQTAPRLKSAAAATRAARA
jgi:hypothetical protein